MRYWVTVFLAVAAAFALASCAGLVPAAGDTAELYDMESYLVARGRLGTGRAAAVVLPLPPVTDTVDAVSPPASGSASAAVVIGEPALPLVPGPSEIGIVTRPVSFFPGGIIALPAPVPPKVAAPVARAPSVPSAAAAKTPPVVTTPATAASTTTAPAASASAAPVATAAAAKKVREVYARVSDEVEVGLDGEGFLFLGFADRQTDGMTFKARTVKDGKTFFRFKALKLGTWDLDFQQQDNATGTTRVEGVRVVVLEEAEFAEAVQRQTASGGEAVLEDIETGRWEWAEKLASIGKETAAIAEYLKGYREGNPELNDRIAVLYNGTKDAAAAEKYWRKNIGTASPWGDRAVVGLARLAVARGDLDGYLAWHRQLLAVSTVPIGDVLVDAALAARTGGDVGLGIDLLSEYGRRYPEGGRMDQAAFVTAQLLEADSPFRDLKRSRDLYAALLREFPESGHAAEAAERLRYLDQHFFTIR